MTYHPRQPIADSFVSCNHPDGCDATYPGSPLAAQRAGWKIDDGKHGGPADDRCTTHREDH